VLTAVGTYVRRTASPGAPFTKSTPTAVGAFTAPGPSLAIGVVLGSVTSQMAAGTDLGQKAVCIPPSPPMTTTRGPLQTYRPQYPALGAAENEKRHGHRTGALWAGSRRSCAIRPQSEAFTTNRRTSFSGHYPQPWEPPPSMKSMPFLWNHAGSLRRRTLPCQARLQSLAAPTTEDEIDLVLLLRLTMRPSPPMTTTHGPLQTHRPQSAVLCHRVPSGRAVVGPSNQSPIFFFRAVGRTLVPGALRANSPHVPNISLCSRNPRPSTPRKGATCCVSPVPVPRFADVAKAMHRPGVTNVTSAGIL